MGHPNPVAVHTGHVETRRSSPLSGALDRLAAELNVEPRRAPPAGGRLARDARADVVLTDIRMPDLDGLAATRQITADENLADVKVLILTTFEVAQAVFEALRSGASGFLGKGSRPDVLIEAIRTVARGDALLYPPPPAA
jgi:DNA-binding NarL/FixJ family response regulator